MRLLFTALTALVSAAGLAHADQLALKDTVPHITTTGTAATEVVPDLADVRLGVRTSG